MTSLLPDRPLRPDDQDLLGRELFANSLADLIVHAPPKTTLRLGVYGGWGEGKTSVLAMMHKRLAEAGHVCVWLSPWIADTAGEFVNYFIKSVAHALEIDAKKLRVTKAASQATDRLREVGREASGYYRLVDIVAGRSIQTAVDKYGWNIYLANTGRSSPELEAKLPADVPILREPFTAENLRATVESHGWLPTCLGSVLRSNSSTVSSNSLASIPIFSKTSACCSFVSSRRNDFLALVISPPPWCCCAAARQRFWPASIAL